MNHTLSQRGSVSAKWLLALVLGSIVSLSGCSDEGTVTTLDRDESVSIDLPRFSDYFETAADRIRPVGTLSNGVSLSLNSINGGDSWEAPDVLLETGRTYVATITWIETDSEGRELPLASGDFDFQVASDGSVVAGNAIEYFFSIFDFDGDTKSNLEERENQTDPFDANDPDPTGTPTTDDPPVIDNPPSEVDPATIVPGPNIGAVSSELTNGVDQVTEVNLTISLNWPQLLFEGSFIQPDSQQTFDLNDLRPLVVVRDGGAVDMTPVRADRLRWTGTVTVQAGTEHKFFVTWIENYTGANFIRTDLPLMKYQFDISVANTGFASVDYTSSESIEGDGLNADGDMYPNAEERRKGDDPFSSDNNSASVPLPPSLEQPGVYPADVIVPRISPINAPVIDGMNVTFGANDQLTGEWAQAVQTDVGGTILSIDKLMVDINAETTGQKPYRRWAAMHDGNYLYIVVTVDDDGQRYRDSGLSISRDDSLELFLDADNSKLSAYDSNDFHYVFPVRQSGGPANTKVGVFDGEQAGQASSNAPFDIEFATGPGIGPDGIRRKIHEQDVYELRLNLNSVNISSDAAFGFELQINDDDDGGDRDSKWGWKHPARGSFNIEFTDTNPSYMGTLELD